VEPSFVTGPVPGTRGFWALVGDATHRPGGRRALSVLVAVLVVAGVAMLSYPAVTDFLARERQNQLAGQYNPGSSKYQRAWLEGKIKVGEGLTRLIIPKLGVNVIVVQGVTESALTAGAGHYPQTPLPCARGNVAIAGHRTTYGRPFNQLNRMSTGNTVILETPFEKCTYAVVPPFAGHGNPWAVLPYDTAVISQQGVLGRGHWLTLTTCDPPGSATYRLILRLRLVSIQQLRALPVFGGPAKASSG
jgi:sortase A